MNFPFEKILNEIPTDIQRLSGGDINDVYEYKTSKGEFVIKINDEEKFPNMLAMEAVGLAELISADAIHIPQVFDCGSIDGKQFLILEKIWTLDPQKNTWLQLGEQLAKLHLKSNTQFGFKFDNYIGKLKQPNKQEKNWIDFLIQHRLQPMLEMAVNQGDVNYVESKIVESLYPKLTQLIPAEKPSLLHGDLWSGNFLTGPSYEPVLIDPAVYYGHREMDLAMMHLFGGFSPLVIEKYNEVFPLEKDWEKRIELNQLYPLLVHVNLFGRSYWRKVKYIAEKFV
jgi:protein-ribulosamine 3-kinase